MPRTTCQAVDEANFGYGDSEYHECTDPATHRGWYDDRYTGRARVHLCKWHAKRTPEVKTYRYRTVAK